MLCHFKENNSTIHQLDRNLCSIVTLLCLRLASHHNSAPNNLERHIFWMDFITSRSAFDSLGATPEPTLYPQMKNIINWHTQLFQLLRCSDVGRPEVKKMKTKNLLRGVYLVPRTGELIAPQNVRTRESSVQGGTRSRMSVLLEGRLPVTSSTPTQLPLLLHLYSKKRKSGDLHSFSTFGTENLTHFCIFNISLLKISKETKVFYRWQYNVVCPTITRWSGRTTCPKKVLQKYCSVSVSVFRF